MSKPVIRLFDFQVDNSTFDNFDDDNGDKKKFLIKMFGMNEKGKTFCIFVKDFLPFFYILVPDNWEQKNATQFKQYILNNLSDFYQNSIISCNLIKKKKLYGFDNFKKYKFLKLEFKNTMVFNKVKNFWYTGTKNFKKRSLKKEGFYFEETRDYLKLYEATLPPLLRFFHMQNISPSGWSTFKKKVKKIPEKYHKTNCDYEFKTTYDNIVSLKDKEDSTPMKIMSFDIEASSSHGDFPVAKKTYRKMLGEIIQYWTIHKKKIIKMNPLQRKELFINLVLAAFKYKEEDSMSEVYLKEPNKKPSKSQLKAKIEGILSQKIMNLIERKPPTQEEKYWEYQKWQDMDNDEREKYKFWDMYIPYYLKKNDVLYCLNEKLDAGKKLDILDKAFETNKEKKIFYNFSGFLPELEGDKCTFIGSTFLTLGEQEPYYNNMIVLNECNDTPEVPNSEIIWKKNEKNVLLEWTKLIQRENPDIILGYNIFGFDWKFLIQRSEELNCKEDFLKLGRNKNEVCQVKESTTTVASGTYELIFVKTTGRLQIDLYNYFRKNENLPAYKLDYVASYFIGDGVKDYDVIENKTRVKSYNLMGLKNGHFICFEILGHSSDKYKEGKKFKISNLNIEEGYFEIEFKLDIDKKSKFRWCLAKDDITPQDIFRLSNEGPDSKAIVAKYCFQDCNLVHNLMIKNDIFTAMIEQANICSVPIEFVAMRGQGIKLLSFISKECSKTNTVIPVLEKDKTNEGYEGAICLIPKKGLYKDNPVAVVDYSSLYPSCMISENISHDSKVWTKEYDLEGNEIKIWGIRDENGDFIYDNLPDYKYVDITYDTYKYVRKTEKSAAEKIKCGTKTCRFVQFKDNKKGIMPTVLQELLASRKATRKLIKYKTVTTNDNKEYIGLLTKDDNIYKIKTSKGEEISVEKENVKEVKDTYNDFMKNVFDKRQSSKKIVANSLYGQCGAKTSSFNDKDIAASTTATGRKLLLYGKRVIEECYNNTVVETKKYGKVVTKSEYIYGDTDSVFFTFNLEELNGTKIKGKKALEITIELAIEAGKLASKFLKNPHDLEYEKTFDPFLLLSKKRYVGLLYETNPNKCKMKSMGIVLKRRDNAACVKDCYGRIVDMLMKGESADSSAGFVKSYIKDMIDEKIGIDKLIITKSLNGFYKNPEGQCHKVLADRIAKRDPGNKPSVGSRVPFVYIQTKKKVKLQGDRVETPDFIIKNELKPDYSHYISNQIMKPVTQIFNLLLEQMSKFNNTSLKSQYAKKYNILMKKYKNNSKKLNEQINKLRDNMVKDIIFNDILRVNDNKKRGQKSITSFFG